MSSPSYDFIIIGGGTAGLVLAARLSEDPTQQILVLEAGVDLSEDIRIKTPGLWASLINSDATWSFETQPQEHLNGRPVHLDQGKALGGSSSTNCQVFVPPTWTSFDVWESVLGNDGWNRSTIQKYYEKSFTVPPINELSEKTLGIEGWTKTNLNKSCKGPVQLSFSGAGNNAIREIWTETFKAEGQCMSANPFLDTSTDSALIGSFSSLSSVDPKTNERSSANTAYLNPNKHRTNLHVLTNSLVEKIIFEDNDITRATGVQYSQHGNVETALCSKEVIVAAGALQSPKILELSGIGDRTVLQKHGIKLVKDLPVGENLQDHLVIFTAFEIAEDLETFDDLVRKEPWAIDRAMEEYETSRSGILSSMGVDACAYLPVMSEEGRKLIEKALKENPPPSGNRPDEVKAQKYYEIARSSLLNPQEPSGTLFTHLGQTLEPVNPSSNSPAGPVPGKFLSLAIMLAHPLSTGSVHIGSGDPLVAPSIDPRYLSNPVDAEVLAQHVLYLKTLVSLSPLNKFLKQPLRYRDPASNATDIETAKEFVRTSARSMWHCAGSCAMLPEGLNGVVSSQLKVHGIKNVRVVDSSAIPLIATANIQSTVYAFAERAADIIKQEYGLK